MRKISISSYTMVVDQKKITPFLHATKYYISESRNKFQFMYTTRSLVDKIKHPVHKNDAFYVSLHSSSILPPSSLILFS